MSTLLTSDTHFSHGNIIKYANRKGLQPGDLDASGNWVSQDIKDERARYMDKYLKANWNARVKQDDTVLHLGDVLCYGNERGTPGLKVKVKELIKELNGTIVFIRGNHDRNNSVDFGLDHGLLTAGGKRILLIHNPAHVDPAVADALKIDVVACGHVHTAWALKEMTTASGRIIPTVNVGVDVRKYAPMTLSEFLGEVYKWEHGKKLVREVSEEAADTRTLKVEFIENK